MIFTARKRQEKCQEQNVDLYMTFVDLTKVFDTVSREGFWKIMAKFGCPAKFIALVRQFHDGMLARVQNDGEFSEPFPVTNGVKQGCVLASTLFSMMFSAMLTDAFQDGDNGIPIRYRFDGKKVREKSRECHNHKPQPFPDPKRKRKPTNLNKHKPNKRTKSTKISSLFPKRGNRNTKKTEKHKNKMTHGKTYNKSPRRINHKATKSKSNTGTTALERSVEQTTVGGWGWGEV